MGIAKSLRRFEHEFDIRAEKLIWNHPFLGFLAIFVGMPILILVCVCVSTVVIAFPMAWLSGWL